MSLLLVRLVMCCWVAISMHVLVLWATVAALGAQRMLL
jgi:hypothetical protein